MPDYREMADHSPAMVWRVGEDKVVDWASKPWLEFTGHLRTENMGHAWDGGIHEQDRDRSAAAFDAAFNARKPFTATYRLRRADGEYRWVVDNAQPFMRDGAFAGYFGSVTDITDQHDARAELADALGQRDMLLGEIYHRVKNNLQQIDGLIALESARIADIQAQRAMQSISNRVRAMASVHQILMKSENLRQIAADAFLAELVKELARASGAERKGISITVSADRILMHVDKAMALGLIVNELVTNSVKHGFPDNEGGKIRIDFSSMPGDGKVLEVSDTGVGLKDNRLDPAASNGSGMRLIAGFAEQLNAKLTTASEAGTTVRLELP